MTIQRLALASLAMVSLAACAPPGDTVDVPVAAAPRQVLRVPIIIDRWDMNAYGRSGCYAIGNQHVKYKVLSVDGGDLESWRRAAEAVTSDCDRSAPSDARWYYAPVPEDGSKTLLVLWKNVDTKAYDFVAIQYDDGRWRVTTNSGTPVQLVEARRQMFNFKTNGQNIRIEVEDMANKDAWAPNEIKWRILR